MPTLVRAPSRNRETLAQAEDRSQQLMQCREPELGLRLDTDGGQSLPTRGLRATSHISQQRRLPDAGIAAYHQRSAAVPETIDQFVEVPHLVIASDQGGRLEFGGDPPGSMHLPVHLTASSHRSISMRASPPTRNDLSDPVQIGRAVW